MELLRDVVVFVHLIGFATLFGAWVTEVVSKQFRLSRVMDYGLLVSLLTGLALAAPWPAGIELNYPKLGLKLALLVVIGALIGMGAARQKRTGQAVPRGMFYAVGVLVLTAAGVAVAW